MNRKDQDRANSITTNPGNRPTDNFIKVRNATKKGYIEAYVGDGIDYSFAKSTTRRGRVQHEMCQTITSGTQCVGTLCEDYRIRKLTPLECWRLMGFDDEDFIKAKAAGISDTQLYKQAGNSIVVNVLEAILTELFN